VWGEPMTRDGSALCELVRRLEAAEDREAARKTQLKWVLPELRFARVRLPIAEQQRIDDLQRELGAW
jgi:hypothetical protein